MKQIDPSNTETSKIITKKIFLDYFKKPYPLWFIQDSEIDNIFLEHAVDNILEEVGTTVDLFEVLRNIDSTENLLSSNFFKLSRLINKKLLAFYREKFKLPTLSIHDHSAIKEDKTEQILETLRTSNRAFFFNPTIRIDDLKINPTVLYKYNGHIYLIEHFWSTSLKREILGTLSFYNYVLFHLLDLMVDQYFVSYLSSKPSPNKELLVEINNSIPEKTKKVYPEELWDPRLKNVNEYFGLGMTYEGTLYEVIYDQKTYDLLITSEWEEKNLIFPQKAIATLREFLKEENRTLDFKRIANIFLVNKNFVVPSESSWFKLIFSNMFRNFTFSGSLIRLDKFLRKILAMEDEEKRLFYIDYVSKIGFLNFPEDQDYIVFESAVNHFKTLKQKRVKVYYDFESISTPFPYFENTKPYMQIVLQLSLIKMVDDEEVDVVNLIIDPLTLSVDDFKKIIDLIYVDEPGVAYIVYNKSFENSRLKEMADLIKEYEYTEKVVSIIDRTVDLADWFTFGNNPFIIHRKLQGFHSIKKVIKLISQEIQDKTGAVQYSDLKRCQNGVMAQALLVSRALSENPKLDEHDWNKNKEFMYKYCENDVRSMIAVEMFIEELLENNKYGLYSMKEFKSRKESFKRSK